MRVKKIKIKTKKPVVLLENWSVATIQINPYMAPELIKKKLVGTVTNHPKVPDGTIVTTSRIVNVNGLMVDTGSGSLYKLGKISPDYLKWMQDNNIEYNEENPIKIIDEMEIKDDDSQSNHANSFWNCEGC